MTPGRVRAGAPTSFCVTSYNVLSSHLAQPDHFQACNPADLDQHTRLRRVKQKLKPEMEKGSILCLQEVSTKWAGPLHTFFQNHGYHFVTGLYGKPFNGYMGVALAWPNDKYEAVDVDISRLSDCVRWAKPPPPTLIQRIAKTITDVLLYPLRLVLRPEPQKNAWTEAKNRYNQFLFARLKHIDTGKVLCVGTYHMPCMFFLPAVMVIHTALAVQRIKALAGNDPHVLAGDFNFKPGSSMYDLVTTGKMDKGHPERPVQPAWESWAPTVPQPMHSAYKELKGAEPDFTNYAKIKDNEPFIDTLDYIFYSPQLRPVEVIEIPNRTEMAGPLPTSDEPSDHVMIGATFEFKKE